MKKTLTVRASVTLNTTLYGRNVKEKWSVHCERSDNGQVDATYCVNVYPENGSTTRYKEDDVKPEAVPEKVLKGLKRELVDGAETVGVHL